MHIYDYSVGRNGVLLLNIPPDRRGRFADPDCARLLAFGAEIKRIYQLDLAEGAVLSGTNTFAPDGQPEHCWSPTAKTDELVIDLPQAVVFNRILLQEDITAGQHVETFAVDAWLENGWSPFANGGTIGYKRILSTNAPNQAQCIRLRILAARAAPKILRLGLFLQ
jgi:alpha-L-fucosidase